MDVIAGSIGVWIGADARRSSNASCRDVGGWYSGSGVADSWTFGGFEDVDSEDVDDMSSVSSSSVSMSGCGGACSLLEEDEVMEVGTLQTELDENCRGSREEVTGLE